MHKHEDMFPLGAKGCAQSEVKSILSVSVKTKMGTVRKPRAIMCPKGEIQEWRGHSDEGFKMTTWHCGCDSVPSERDWLGVVLQLSD